MSKRVYIYELVDPRNGQVHYVGQTTNPKERHRQYRYASNNIFSQSFDFHQWLMGLRVADVRVRMNILEETTKEDAWERESYWIQKRQIEGSKLFNKNGCGLPHKRPAGVRASC